MRILVLSHAHPALSAGGGERAAYSLFANLKRHAEITEAHFAAAASPATLKAEGPVAYRGRSDESLAAFPPVDGFTFQSEDVDRLRAVLGRLVDTVRPDLVHAHHFYSFGLELFPLLRELGMPSVLTLHEYLLICGRWGQMVRPGETACASWTPADCHGCFPDRRPELFWLRAEMIRALLADADTLIAPSHFLANRFEDWGVPQGRVHVIENLLSPDAVASVRRRPNTPRLPGPLRLGFFGKMHLFKGVHVLLEAVRRLPADIRGRIRVGLHGEPDPADHEYKARLAALLPAVADVVTDHGPYENGRVLDLMRGYDRVVIPSLWPENSPVVVQEARLAGVPLLVSAMGGLAEKAAAPDDLAVAPGDPDALATAISRLAQAVPAPPGDSAPAIAAHEDAARRHLALYRELIGAARQSRDSAAQSVRISTQ